MVVRRIILARLPLREAQVKSRYLRQGASARSEHVGTESAQLQAFGLGVTVWSLYAIGVYQPMAAYVLKLAYNVVLSTLV